MKRNYKMFFPANLLTSNCECIKMTTAFRSATMLSLAIYFVLLFLPLAYGATVIQGIVIAKRVDSVKVEYNKTADPLMDSSELIFRNISA